MFVSRAGPPSKGLGAAFRSRLARCLTWTAKLTFEAFGNVPNWTPMTRRHADQARDFRCMPGVEKVECRNRTAGPLGVLRPLKLGASNRAVRRSAVTASPLISPR